MKITFDGHISSTRETELSQEELAEIFEAVKYQFLTHIQYTSVFERETSYETPENLTIRNLCENHGVDVAYTPDRLNFFTSVLEALGNPYEPN
jgi:hypothetical protein